MFVLKKIKAILHSLCNMTLQMWKKVIYKTPSHHFRRHDC